MNLLLPLHSIVRLCLGHFLWFFLPQVYARGLDVFCFLPCLSQNLHHFLFAASRVDF